MNYLTEYPLIPYKDIMKYDPLADKLKVSIIARGKTQKEGFMEAYKKYGKNLPEFWLKKRHSFLRRTLAAYYKKPSIRRWLSIIFWAYMP